RITAAGSPGVRCTNMKTTMPTISITGISINNRRRIYVPNEHPYSIRNGTPGDFSADDPGGTNWTRFKESSPKPGQLLLNHSHDPRCKDRARGCMDGTMMRVATLTTHIIVSGQP